jgi:ribonuclease HI
MDGGLYKAHSKPSAKPRSQRSNGVSVTKFLNKSFSVGYEGERITDTEWDIAVGLRCPNCISKYDDGTLHCSNCSKPSECEHKWDEFRLYEVVCSRCLACREYTPEDERNLAELAIGYFDGGSSENPGQGAYGWALEYPDKTTMTDVRSLGIVSNNVAEYEGLINLLQYALDHGVRRIKAYGDSMLIINQSSNKWKVKNGELRPLAMRARELVAKFEHCELIWIPREQNGQCDALVKAKIREVKTSAKFIEPERND